MPDPVEHSDFYAVKANSRVTLSITIGNGQVGGTDVTFDGAPLGSGAVTDLLIGAAGQDLKNTSVDCLTTVRRQNASSGLTSVTYTLKGGVQDRDYVYPGPTLPQIGDRVVYDVSFVFS